MEAFDAASGAPLLDGYGITETSTMVTMNWPSGARPPGSCGLPVPGCAVRIVDPVSGEDVARGGENIYPAEVEQVIAAHDAVADAAVIGVPDEALGEIVLAFVVLAGEDIDDEALHAFAARRLAAFKVPARFERIDPIPRTGSGKVQRHRLAELARRPRAASADRR